MDSSRFHKTVIVYIISFSKSVCVRDCHGQLLGNLEADPLVTVDYLLLFIYLINVLDT